MIVYYYVIDDFTNKFLKKSISVPIGLCFTKNINEEPFFHRENDLPAYIADGFEYYLIDGYFHRENGAAIISKNENINYYFYNGYKINVSSNEEFNKYVRLINFK